MHCSARHHPLSKCQPVAPVLWGPGHHTRPRLPSPSPHKLDPHAIADPQPGCNAEPLVHPRDQCATEQEEVPAQQAQQAQQAREAALPDLNLVAPDRRRRLPGPGDHQSAQAPTVPSLTNPVVMRRLTGAGNELRSLWCRAGASCMVEPGGCVGCRGSQWL